MTQPSLQRFKKAQDEDFDTALRELRRGRKETHWIWYVFPQLRGLGRSSTAIRFGLQGAAEAREYLRDDVLRGRLLVAMTAVRDQLARDGAGAITELMGSEVDAMKLISSMTLFRNVADQLNRVEPLGDYARLMGLADAILEAGERQGHPPCRFTLQELRAEV